MCTLMSWYHNLVIDSGPCRGGFNKMCVYAYSCPAIIGIDVMERPTSLQTTLTLIYVIVHFALDSNCKL